MTTISYFRDEHENDLEKFFGKKLHDCVSVPPIDPGLRRRKRGSKITDTPAAPTHKTSKHVQAVYK